MSHRVSDHRRVRTLLFVAILLIGLVPVGVASADGHRTSTRTEVSFTSTPVEIIDEGEEWVDEAGTYHFTGEVSREVVEGDINGEAIVTIDGEFVPGPGCTPDDEECMEGQFSAWGSVVITDENGAWDGKFLIANIFEPDEEPFSFGKAILAGRGGNAGMSLVVDITFSDDEEDDTAYFDGFIMSMAKPTFGINMHTQLCASESSNTMYGAFLSHGAIESSGGAWGDFFSGGTMWTHRYGLFGEVGFSDDYGSLTIQFLGTAQDNWQTSVGWGHWVIVDGTGAYEHLNGHGKMTGSAGEFEQCSLGWGVRLQFIGQTHMN